MNVIDNATSFEELEEGFHKKIQDTKLMLNLKCGWGTDTVADIVECHQLLSEIQEQIKFYKQQITSAKNQIVNLKQLYGHMDLLSNRLTYMKDHLPKRLPCLQNEVETVPSKVPDAPIIASEKENKENFQNVAKSCSKAKSASNLAKITYISLTEYESVPKYTKGRIPYEKVNITIDEINGTLEKKYQLMKKPRSKLSPIEMSWVAGYKNQSTKETKGLHFIVEEDLKRFSKLKLDTAGRNTLTILRTLKRIKEVRGPGSLLRYCIIV